MIKDGPAGVHAINAFFQHHQGTARDRIDVDGCRFYVGDPVMYLVNDYELGL
jgi:ATP-dependent exoDNAse (exonuclease V) alpha subunit